MRRSELRIVASNLTEEDQLSFSLNGEELRRGTEAPSFNDCRIEFPLSAPQLRTGKNELEVFLLRRNPLISPSVQIGTVHLSIAYRQ